MFNNNNTRTDAYAGMCVTVPFLFKKDSLNVDQYNKDFLVMDPSNKFSLYVKPHNKDFLII